MQHLECVAAPDADVGEMPLADVAERRRDPVEEGLGADEAVIGEHVGAVGEMLARAEADLQMQRPLVPEQGAGGDFAGRRQFDPRQERVDKLLLPGAQFVPARPAVQAVESQRIAGFERGHGDGAKRSSRGSASGRQGGRVKKPLLSIALMLFGASPAMATGGLICRTAGARPIEVALVVSHTAISTIVSARLTDDGRKVPVALAQSWLEPNELRLDLTDPNAARHELRVRVTRSGARYDGSLWRGGRRRWVRCREG